MRRATSGWRTTGPTRSPNTASRRMATPRRSPRSPAPTRGWQTPWVSARIPSGTWLVANQSGGSVSEFANPASFGDQAPSLWIGGSAAQLTAPTGVDVDAADRLYVADGSGIASFAPGATTPRAVIPTGSTSRLTNPSAVAVAPPLAIATGSMPTAALGQRYRQQARAVLGEPPLRWRLARGRLPRGLTLSPAGLIVESRGGWEHSPSPSAWASPQPCG